MSETTFDIAAAVADAEEAPDGVVTPQPDSPTDIPTEPPTKPQSAAERVRARFRGESNGDGARPAEPSSGRRARRPFRPAPPKPREGSLVKPLTEMYTGVGLMLAPVDPVCSAAFINNAETCARSLETLARENEAVRRAILAMTQTSAWGGVIIAHLPILLMVMTHHGPKEMKERTAAAALLMNPQAMAHFQTSNETGTEEA